MRGVRTPSNVPATIIRVKPWESGFAGVVEVRENQTRKIHQLISGSVNGVPEALRQVGQKGYISWMGGNGAGFFLPYFHVERK